jgi:DNA polymerase III subunit delta
VPDLKPAYLVYGQDQAKFDAWRKRLRVRASDEGPSATLEVVRGDVDAAVSAIGTLTLSVGRSYVLIDGVERWSDRDQKRVEEALGQQSGDTLVVFIAWGKEPPRRLAKAVKGVGGDFVKCERPRSYPAWIGERATELGFEMDREAAQLLAELIGKDVEGDKADEREQRRQTRLLHEIEKLALFASGGRVDASAVESLTRSAVETRIYALADAIIDQDPERAIRIAEELRGRGEDFMYILFALLRQLRSCQLAWAMRTAGRSRAEIEREVGGNPWAAKATVEKAARADGEQIARALEMLADLDYAIRGAGQHDPETELTLTVVRAAGSRDRVPA